MGGGQRTRSQLMLKPSFVLHFVCSHHRSYSQFLSPNTARNRCGRTLPTTSKDTWSTPSPGLHSKRRQQSQRISSNPVDVLLFVPLLLFPAKGLRSVDMSRSNPAVPCPLIRLSNNHSGRKNRANGSREDITAPETPLQHSI